MHENPRPSIDGTHEDTPAGVQPLVWRSREAWDGGAFYPLYEAADREWAVFTIKERKKDSQVVLAVRENGFRLVHKSVHEGARYAQQRAERFVAENELFG
jgi:hypothetical protein